LQNSQTMAFSEQLPYSPGLVAKRVEGRMSTWPVLACVAGILLTYVFRVLFARWYYRGR
jgi:hypothetical protein